MTAGHLGFADDNNATTPCYINRSQFTNNLSLLFITHSESFHIGLKEIIFKEMSVWLTVF